MIRIASSSSSSSLRSRIVRLATSKGSTCNNYNYRSPQVSSSLLPNEKSQQCRSLSVMVGYHNNNRRIQQQKRQQTNNGSNPLLVSLITPNTFSSISKNDKRTFFSFSSSKNNDKDATTIETTGSTATNDTDSFSSTTDGNSVETSNTIDVDDAINKLFEDSQQQQQQLQQQDIVDKVIAADSTVNTSGDAWYAGAVTDNATTAAAYIDWTPVWYNLADQAVVCVKLMHEVSGLEYGWTIVATTAAMRLVLFPIMVNAQRTTSRMAHVQPELNALKARYEALGTPSRQEQVQFVNNTKALFARYDVKPFRAFLAPIIQIPLFMSFFFGLRKMPHIYADEFSTGGMLWFIDLTIPDPYYILPIASSVTFLGLIELGKTQMMATNPAQGQLMTNVFRAMALFMLPVCVSFEASMLCYWTANNIVTVGQTLLLQQPAVKKYFGIWDPPKPVPGTPQPESFMQTIEKLQKRAQGKPLTDAEAIKKHNATVDAKKTAIRMVRASRASRSSSSLSSTAKK